MSDRHIPDSPAVGAAERAIEKDLRALAGASAAGLLGMNQIETQLALRVAEPGNATKGRWLMRLTEGLKLRPRFAVGLVTAALAAAVLMFPISYERVVGQDVTLSIHGRMLARPELRAIADQLKLATTAKHVQVRMQNADLTLTAQGRGSDSKAVQQRVEALVRALRTQGLTAEVTLVPHREKQESRVYAAALAKIFEIHVTTTGKTDTQVEDEIRDQLTRAGVSPTSVQFQRGTDGTQLNIEASAPGREIKIIRKHNDPAETEVNVSVDDLDTARDPGMTDAQLEEKIRKQIEAKGLSATVTVTGDRIEIRAQHHKTPSP